MPVDVGKHAAMASMFDLTGVVLAAPFEFDLDRAAVWARDAVVSTEPGRRISPLGLLRVGGRRRVHPCAHSRLVVASQGLKRRFGFQP